MQRLINLYLSYNGFEDERIFSFRQALQLGFARSCVKSDAFAFS